MAELLVRVKDKVNPDSIYLDCRCTKRGDVIVIRPDGWAWGREERANEAWRIIVLPGIDPDVLTPFLVPEPETDPRNPSKVLQRRAFRFDLDALVADQAKAVEDNLNDDTRAVEKITAVNVDDTKALTVFKKVVTKLADPNVLGDSPTEIG